MPARPPARESRGPGADAGATAAELGACRRGERVALEAVLRRHAELLERALVRLVGPGADLEDLLQETFAAAIVGFARFRGDAAVATWLYRIAVNVACKHLRRPQRRRTVSLELVPAAADLAAIGPDPAEAAHDAQLGARLYAHLDALAPKKRIAFLLHVVDDRPLAEVAALMGATRAATKSRVFFARRELLARVRADAGLRELVAVREAGR